MPLWGVCRRFQACRLSGVHSPCPARKGAAIGLLARHRGTLLCDLPSDAQKGTSRGFFAPDGTNARPDRHPPRIAIWSVSGACTFLSVASHLRSPSATDARPGARLHLGNRMKKPALLMGSGFSCVPACHFANHSRRVAGESRYSESPASGKVAASSIGMLCMYRFASSSGSLISPSGSTGCTAISVLSV